MYYSSSSNVHQWCEIKNGAYTSSGPDKIKHLIAKYEGNALTLFFETIIMAEVEKIEIVPVRQDASLAHL